MPIYEYQCESCGYHYEVMQKMSDNPLVQCPSCAQPSLRKLVSVAGFRLSGSGWYETDFKKSGKRNLVEKEGKESKDAKDGKDGKESAKSRDSKSSGSDKSKPSNATSSSKPAASGT